MLKAGIFGFGGVGQAMANSLRTRHGVEVVGACDIDDQKLKEARALGMKTTKKPRELCSWDVDFVVVSSTNVAHHEHVLAAAEAGKHILCEKPPALTLAELDDMIAATDKAGVVTVVNFSRRFDPASLRLKELADSGELGKILSTTCYVSRGWGLAVAGNPHPAVAHMELSGGWLVHHACHSIDFVVWLMGGAKSAYCRSTTTLEKSDSPEVLWGIMEHASGGVGVVGDTVATMREGFTSIIGTKATVEMIRSPQGESIVMRRETGHEFPYFTDTLGCAPSPHHDGALRDFLACLREGRKCAQDLRSTRESFITILALEQSRRSGKVVRTKDVEAAK